MNPLIESFFDPDTFTVTYVVYDEVGGHAAVIDSVLNFNPKSGRTSTHSADAVIAFMGKNELTLDWILETHAHADHLSAASYIKDQFGGRIAIGEHIQKVQAVFKKIFNLEHGFALDGSQFDDLFTDQETFNVGKLIGCVMNVPGHTPADLAYQFGNAVFVGDTLFMPDVGTARCDFPGGDAHHLYQSIQKILSLPADTKLYMCHDYPPAGRDPVWQTTVAEQLESNIHVHDGVSENDFVEMRSARDETLDMPMLIIPSIQLNIRAGHMPPPEDDGHVYFKIPINVL
ncbi:MAG: MBL fold metallo-hydrolase [Candidatus Saccharibacteria bacterium]|nr:MBL fold metallo-hydrolase [Moraxellaceae bacterium]